MTGHVYRLSVPNENSLSQIEYSHFKYRVHYIARYDKLHKLSPGQGPMAHARWGQSLYAYSLQIINYGPLLGTVHHCKI
jgi:hypothetical protein